MKQFFQQSEKFILLIVIVSQLINTSCSNVIIPKTSFHNIETQAERKQMNDFMDGGTEKLINPNNSDPDEIIRTAGKYLGVPHCMGGTTSKCMDCSGLLVRVFSENGIYLPHNSEEQARYGKILTEIDELQKGDLVFFINTYKTNHFITHSGIYTGNYNFIHTSSKNGVTNTSLNSPWWKEKFVFGTRVFID